MIRHECDRLEGSAQCGAHRCRAQPILSITDLSVRFGNVSAIESLSLTVRRGEFVSLFGPSGCGKSTLLKAVARLVAPPAAGSKRPYADLRTGFMFQKPLLLPWRTTLDNVLLPVEIPRGGDAVDSADRHNALRMLELVRLAISPPPIRSNCPAACSSVSRWRGR